MTIPKQKHKTAEFTQVLTILITRMIEFFNSDAVAVAEIKKDFSDKLSESVSKLLFAGSFSEEEFDNLLTETISSFLQIWFSAHKSIESVYQNSDTSEVLFFNIVLKENTLKKRTFLNRFFVFYEAIPFLDRCPIALQAVPDQLKDVFAKEVAKNDNYIKVI